jgi:hypothetical protein
VDWANPSSVSPRKEFGAAGRSTSIENWRKSKTDEEGGDWRNPTTGPAREKWGELILFLIFWSFWGSLGESKNQTKNAEFFKFKNLAKN